MDVGITTFVTDVGMSPVELAREIEDRGFDGLWVGEHTHIPVDRETPWPLGDDGQVLPDDYARMFDPFVALSAAACATTTLRLGTSVCLVNQHHPLTLAKTVASLDQLSGGRLTFGVGSGWNVEEMAHHGVDPTRRTARLRENVAALRSLWTQEEAAVDGEWVRFGPSWSWPKPVQRPHPPIVVGGGKTVLAEVVDWADGWMPIEGPMPIDALLGRLHRLADEAGRPRSSIDVQVTYATPTPATIEAYRTSGVDGVILKLDSTDRDGALRQLDVLAPLALLATDDHST